MIRDAVGGSGERSAHDEPSFLGTELADLNVYTDHNSLIRELGRADGARRKPEGAG